MTKGRANVSGKSRKKPGGTSSWSRPFRFVALPLVWRLILIIIIVALLLWQWSAVASWATNIAGKAWELFGWGLALIAIVVIIIIGMLWRRQLSALAHRWKLNHWNKWLGAVTFILAIWGILALFNLGGSFGLNFIGQDDFTAILWILGLVIIGIILVAPKACFHLVASFFSWLGRQLKRRPALKQAPQPKPPFPTVPVTPKPPEIEPEKETVTPVLTSTQAQQELKQVAQEVWKKYGESSALTIIDGWRLPPIDILDRAPEVEFSQADNVQRAKLLEEALASYGVEAKIVQINAGPTVTQFGVEPGWDRKMKEIKERDRDGNAKVRLEEVSKTRVKVERITSLSSDLALALAAPSIRIEAPVPGKSVVGIEVPNTILSLVSLRGVIETSVFQKIEARSKLALALGKGAGGEAIAADLSRMPHLLIAGATGSGKTVCLNSIICCLLLHNTPNEVKFIMIDPKRVELTPFNSIPHLANPVIVDTNKALSTLRWLNQEMDKRYQQLAAAGARNIEGYNRNKQGDERLPYLTLIIDELADLMMAGFDEVEHILCRLAQLARATGIHLVVATQRPSVDVVTGLIKANFPTRVSFAVTSQVDSRTILDMGGAEKLLGRGDMLYMPTEAAKPKRLQGCYVSDAETERLVYFWGSQRREEAAQLKIEEFVPSQAGGRREGFPEDPLLETARQLAQEHKHISTSYLQRRLHIGYPRAARIMEQLEEESTKGQEE
ncbi:MAG TPA: DNA translocase FtsK [Dehalococcoidia bacterium]|jgi:S-DNA-T family DNA segregation ATPase FtsK/SpoIIIE|nr:DNA translocase FtsK [Dehalococcoidia bacterium]